MDVYSLGVIILKIMKVSDEDIMKLKQLDTGKYKERERIE